MKNLKLSNKKFLLFILYFILLFPSLAEDQTIDIWKINEQNNKKISESEKKINEEINNENDGKKKISIYDMQTTKNNSSIELEDELNTSEIKIIGLYDPEDYDLDINMWSNSDGDQLKNIFSRLKKIKLSKDSAEILKISLLTNAYYPKKNITEKEYLKLKSDLLLKNLKLDIIELYLLKNQIINDHPELTKYLVNHYLSISKLEKACDIFEKNLNPIQDDYLSKFNIYCLVERGKIDQAQMIYDLKKELGFKDNYFERKINFLLGYTSEIDKKISEKTILDFHLAHRIDPDFKYEPKDKTKKIIWKYLSSANLLSSFQKIQPSELDKISTIELAVHNKNYPEKDLFKLYKRFQFNINQLLNAKTSYKSLSGIESRALIYQKILLESEMVERLKLLKILKKSFEKENLGNAFDKELKIFLKEIDPLDIPDNLTSFYYTNIQIKEDKDKKIKFNNDILHQSKLINYFNGDYSKSKIEKDINNFLKKIKKNKKYSLSKKDIIFLESLKSDGIEIDSKFNDLYEINDDEIPSDIQVMINNNEKGAALLRIVEVIGQDKIERIDEDTMYFIINTLNQLNINYIRNNILLQVLPLKV